jgi:hypothetical protein
MTVESLPEQVSSLVNCCFRWYWLWLDCYFVRYVLHDTSRWNQLVCIPILTTITVDNHWQRKRLLRNTRLASTYGCSNSHCSSSMGRYDALVRPQFPFFLVAYYNLTLSRPRSRDRLCRDSYYHDKYEAFKNACNETISVNWPYEPTDTLIRTSATEFTVNPVFITHVRNHSNWTLGPGFLEKWVVIEEKIADHSNNM